MRTAPPATRREEVATEKALLAIIQMVEDDLTKAPAVTRICGADGCLVRVDESCPACLVRFGIPAERGRFAHVLRREV